MTRELVVLCADGTMRAVFGAFFRRPFHHALGCAQFAFDPARDIFNNPLEKDGGVHRRCHEILRPYLSTHRRALVVLDQQFGGELPADEVRAEMEQLLSRNGWDGRCAVSVIDPELEVLLWQDNPNIERALKHTGPPSLRDQLATDGKWPQGQAKPSGPKALMQGMILQKRIGAPVAVYSQIAGTVSTAACADPAFHRIRDALRAWFPLEQL